MTLEEAKNIIKSECYIADLLDLDRTQMVNIALDTVIEAAEETRWIPVSERLPKKSGKYLVTVKNGNVYAGTYDAFSGKFQCAVTAWRPLPKPYKAEGSDTE